MSDIQEKVKQIIEDATAKIGQADNLEKLNDVQIGRASCRERV